MPAHMMLFLQRILSPFSYSVLSKYALFSTSKLTDVTEFLLKECGFSESQVLALGRRHEDLYKTKSIHRAQQAVQLFRDSGFTEDQVRKIVFIQPNTILLKVDTQLKPKIEFIKALGFTGSNLGHIISRAPRLLCGNLEKNLSPKIQLLTGAFGSKLNLCQTLMRHPMFWLCKIDNLKPKIDILKQSSIQDELLSYVIRLSPYLILRSEEVLKLTIEYVRNLGVLEGSKAFANALVAVDGSGLENVKNKLKHMATLGLLENEILEIVRKFPKVLANGIDKTARNMDFSKNTAGFQPNIVVSNPILLTYSIENRLQPRHKVIEFLRETDPSRLPRNLASVYDLSEQHFADRFLKGSPEATKLFEKYKSKSIDTEVGADRKGVSINRGFCSGGWKSGF